MSDGAAIVLCAGQRVDRGHRADFFPEALEPVVRRAVRARLIELGAVIGYASAAPGGDILFGEALVALGGELNLYLPCDRADFVAQYVAPAGEAWVARFERLCARAARVTISCEENLLGDATLVRFNNQMLQGMARLRGEALDRPPHLMVLWSAMAPPEPGSPADFMDQWPELGRLSVIDLDDLRLEAGLAEPAPVDPDALALAELDAEISPRAVRAILFADIAAYTRFEDRAVPLLFDFLAEAQQRVEERAAAPLLINSWGDAVHAAAETAHDLADYAAALTEAVATIDPAAFGLDRRPRFRMALHAGPVFVGLHPLTGRSMVFGHHVNRAARIEPLALPGALCASQHFVALLKAEMDRRADEAQLTGQVYAPRYRIVYLGRRDLPKSFGSEEVYRVVDGDWDRDWDRNRDGGPGEPEDAMAPSRMAPPDRMQLALDADLGEIAMVAARVEAFCAVHDLGEAVVQAVTLALDELLTNTITYGFPEGTGGGGEAPWIEVALSLAGNVLTARIRDPGLAFDPAEAPAPDLDSDVDDRPIGGLGVHLVREMMDGLEYRRLDGVNEVTLTKRVRPATTDGDSE
ncbi:MAG: hypothetical protein GVY13_02690 [Alphaproteobacteria bacterium]|jgi:anti-sigma regulatory factor (Ser/Thr protein kinase)/class 3 adenylate cyclase|nr:hypothetical protein [Alphaproteobacteria bacterium]